MHTVDKIENQKSPAFSEVGLKYLLTDIEKALAQGTLLVASPSLQLATWHLLKEGTTDSSQRGQPVSIYGTVDSSWYRVCGKQHLAYSGTDYLEFTVFVQDMVLAARMTSQLAAGTLIARQSVSGVLFFELAKWGQ